MEALVKTQSGKGFLEIQNVDEPVAGDGEVLLRVKAAGICGTDIHVWHDTFPYLSSLTSAGFDEPTWMSYNFSPVITRNTAFSRSCGDTAPHSLRAPPSGLS